MIPMMGSQERQREKPTQLKEKRMKSLEFFKPTLAITLAIVLAWLLSVGPAQAGYVVKLQQVGPDVVATGSGAIDLTGLTFSDFSSDPLTPAIRAATAPFGNRTLSAFISTGPTSSWVDSYVGASGPGGFGSPRTTSASSGSGDMVGISVGGTDFLGFPLPNFLNVPKGYVSGTALSDMAIYSGQTFTTLGLTPGTYVWTWGAGANQNFTLQILPAILPAANISNISTRASVWGGQAVAIAGFTITGTDPKQVVIRGLGPTLTNFITHRVLADPMLGLYDGSGAPIVSNNNWQDNQPAEIQATGLAPSVDAESAILITLQPGKYTAILSGASNLPPPIGLVEVYDINPGASAELTNVSTRGFVGTGDGVMIAGFIANGSTQVVVRGLGPTLGQFGVSNTLADPVMTLVDSNGNVVQSNNNWTDTQQAAIEATGFAPPNDLEAAILAPVAAGNYTAILSGNDGGTGIGLVEVYKLP
jgi:hypothetical protein